jgi:SnoaL-like domain
MSRTNTLLPPAAQATLLAWRRYVAEHDPALLETLFAPDVTFRSPFVHKPYNGLAAVRMIMEAVSTVLENVRFERELVGPTDAALEFIAAIGEIEVHGVDIFRFREDGQIDGLEVMVRPHKALLALSDGMSARLGDGLKEFKKPAS